MSDAFLAGFGVVASAMVAFTKALLWGFSLTLGIVAACVVLVNCACFVTSFGRAFMAGMHRAAQEKAHKREARQAAQEKRGML